MKRRFTVLFCLLFAVCLAFGLAACNNKKGGKLSIVLDGEMTDGSTIEFATEISLPSAHVENENGETVSYDVIYRITDAAGKTEDYNHPVFELAPGSYKITYAYGELGISYNFTVKDSNAPVITFSKVPNDLFAGENETGELPTVDVSDEGEVETINRKLEFTDSAGTTENVQLSQMNNNFSVTERGTFKYTVSATDASGNSSEESVSWIVKDWNWTAPATGNEKLYADFADPGYINYVRKGNVSDYWVPSEYAQEQLETYEGASGVLKLTLPFTSVNCTCIRVKTATPIKQADLKGKYIAVRVFIENGDVSDFFGFAGNHKMQLGEEFSCASRKKSPLVKGEWTTYYLSYADAAAIKAFSDENDSTSEPTSDIVNLQFCFSRPSDSTTTDIKLYIDSISIAEDLPNVENLTVSGGTAEWDVVDGATGYAVNVNGTETKTTDCSLAVSGEKGYVTVRALGDGVYLCDSKETMKVYGLVPKDGEYVSYDDELYRNLISEKVNIGSETEGYTPQRLETEYADDKLTVTVGKGAWGVCTAFVMLFPEPVTLNGVEKIVIRMDADIPFAKKEFSICDSEYKKNFGNFTVQDGMSSYIVDVSDFGSGKLAGLQIVYLLGSDMGENVLTFTLDYIAPAVKLGTTSVSADNGAKTISWTAVDNATGYAVMKDGTQVGTTTDLSYDCSAFGKFTTLGVRALGAGRYLDGDVAYADITLNADNDWVSIDGIKYIQSLAYGSLSGKLIQFNIRDGNGMFMENDVLVPANVTMLFKGTPMTVTKLQCVADTGKFHLVYDENITPEIGDEIVIKAGSLFAQASGKTFKIGADFTIICTGAGDYPWATVTTDIITSAPTVTEGWGDEVGAQQHHVQIKVDDSHQLWDNYYAIDASQMNVEFKEVKVAVTVQIDAGFALRMKADFSSAEIGDTLVIKAGSFVYQISPRTAVKFESDFALVWDGTKWARQ